MKNKKNRRENSRCKHRRKIHLMQRSINKVWLTPLKLKKGGREWAQEEA